VRNESYWGRKASLARLVFVAVGDPARALARLRNGEIDMIPNLHPSYYPEQVKTKRMRRRFRLFRIYPYRLRILLYNVGRGPLKDRRVRVALAHLADRQRFIREIRNSLGQVLAVPIWPLSPWYDKSIHPYSYERKEALRLLEAAGWKQTPKGRRRNGYPLGLKMLVAREAPAMSKVAGQLKAELLAAGGRLVVKTGDFGFIKTQLRRGHFDLTLLGLAPRPYSDLSPLLHSKGRVNLGNYHNPMADRLLDGIRATSQEGTRLRLLRQLYRVLHQDPPFQVLYAPIELMLVSRDVKGIASNGRRPVFSALSR
jgi:peptide/nickel transport system substrate-binding protein